MTHRGTSVPPDNIKCGRIKEQVVDERMMTLFSLIAEQVQSKQDLFDKEGKIMEALLNNGYRIQEADTALTLMQTLVKQQEDDLFTPRPMAVNCLRAMSREERERFTVDAFGFVAKLTHLGIITEDQREELLERAMSAYAERIELEQIKTLIAFSLFHHASEQDDELPLYNRNIRRTAWN